MSSFRSSVVAVAVALLLAIVGGLPGSAHVAGARAATATGPKVVIVVGATHGVTQTYRDRADAAYAEAIKYTPNVVKVYSPNATWSAVKAAAKGANILIYFGHGNGWPSPYTYDPQYTTKDGFGLNATAGNGDYDNKYYGEPYVSTLELAPNALVMLHHLCYASGNSEPGGAAPSASVARKRIDNYGAGFLRGGRARAVLADGHRGPVDYLRAIFTTNQTIESLWRTAPNANGNVTTFAGTRSVGATAFMDPDAPTSGYYRSLIGDRNLTTKDIIGGFAIPGHASPKGDGAPLYATVPTTTGDTAGATPAAVLPPDTRLTILARVAGSGDSAVFQVQGLDDASIAGYAIARDLEPRDSVAPYLIALGGGGGRAYRSADAGGHHALTGTFNEASTWSVTVSRGDTAVTTATGSGTTFTVDADVAAAGGEGRYTYKVTATDGWSNTGAKTGTFTIDDTAPTLAAVTPGADAVAWVSPNGDKVRESAAWAATPTEAGSIGLRIVDKAGDTVRSLRVTADAAATSVAWDGRTSAGTAVPDGTYEARLTPRDAAGNDGPTVKRPVLVDTTLGFVGSSKRLFYPQDGDRLAKSTSLRFTLTRPATVTWTVRDANGAVVATLLDATALPAGTVSRTFAGRRSDGTFLPKGTYRSVVSVAGDGPVAISQAATFRMQAFAITASDTTPGRGQRVTITAVTAEALSTTPRMYVMQPGKSTWSVALRKVATATYRVTLTVKSGGGKGTIAFRVVARDIDGRNQSTTLYLPLH